MIGFLNGILAEKGDGFVIIDVNGVGYVVNTPANTGAYLKAVGDNVKLYTRMIVREDDMSLYGFSTRGELDTFIKLIGVNGVGPKAGISILSSKTLSQLKTDIAMEDVRSLQQANGIGKKTAERIVLELKDKFAADLSGNVDVDMMRGDGPASVAAGGYSDALNALVALGYSRAEALSALSGMSGEELTTEEYIKKALKNLV